MTLTRKHFETTADILRTARNWKPDDELIDTLVEDFANWFESENPRFDRKEFVARCTHRE